MYPLTYIARHGQTDWNAEKRLQGQTDTLLNDTGRWQADHNGRLLAALIGGDHAAFRFVSSPMRRARETMERMRVALGLDADGYDTDPLLKELSFGDWERHTFEELDALNPGTSLERAGRKWTFVPPGEGAESYEILAGRVAGWLETLDRPTVCVAHGGTIRALFHLVNGLPGDRAVEMEVHQGRLLKLEGARIDWI